MAAPVIALALLCPPALAAGSPTPTPSVTSGGSGTPTPSSGAGSAAGAGHGDLDEHAAAALVAATAALRAAEGELAAARAELASAEAARAAAEAAATAAEMELHAATVAEEGARRELSAIEARIAGQIDDLGRLARTAYMASGPLETWAVLLDSESPADLANRASTLGAIASVGNARLARLAESRADQVDARDRLAAARAYKEKAARVAQQALVTRQVEEATARAAAEQVTAVVTARRAALAAALKAQRADQARYAVLIAVSGRLGERIREAAARLAKTANPPRGTGQMSRPGRGLVTSPYGPRLHPILNYVKLHTGVDLAKADGIVYAADDGVVLLAERNVAYGNMTVVGHGSVGTQGVATLYAHQAAVFVRPGDRVVKGQPIGLVGSTGYSTGPHLHFEVRIDGRPVDPMPWLVNAPMPPLLTTTLPPVVPVLSPAA